jgi:hypothetical protein
MRHNKRKIAILITLSLVGLTAFAFTYRAMAGGRNHNSIPLAG